MVFMNVLKLSESIKNIKSAASTLVFCVSELQEHDIILFLVFDYKNDATFIEIFKVILIVRSFALNAIFRFRDDKNKN